MIYNNDIDGQSRHHQNICQQDYKKKKFLKGVLHKLYAGCIDQPWHWESNPQMSKRSNNIENNRWSRWCLSLKKWETRWWMDWIRICFINFTTWEREKTQQCSIFVSPETTQINLIEHHMQNDIHAEKGGWDNNFSCCVFTVERSSSDCQRDARDITTWFSISFNTAV